MEYKLYKTNPAYTTGNTRVSRMCVILEYRYYTMNPYQYHELL